MQERDELISADAVFENERDMNGKSLTVREIRNILVNEFDVLIQDANKLKKTDAKNMLCQLQQEQVVENIDWNGVEVESVSIETPDSDNDEELLSPEAQQKKIMDMFCDTELLEGNPMIHGLRRVASIEFGPILESLSEIAQVPSLENGYRATVKVDLVFSNGKRISGCADACMENAPDIFGKHPVALAETRAESRALRRALNIKKPSAEEVDGFSATNLGGEKIKPSQVLAINAQCKKQEIDVNKFLALKFGTSCDNIEEVLTDILALEAIEILKKYRNNEEEIPENIKLENKNG